MKVDLQTRDLKTGNTSPMTFESVEEALTWLKVRPKYVDVLGIASHHVPPDVSDQLKAAMRPLDDEEKSLDEKHRKAREGAAEKAAKARAAAEAAAAQKQLADAAKADPNRPLDVRWHHRDGLMVANAADKREISDEVRVAVEAWVAERGTWVASRQQVVGDARLQVWPSEIPEDQGDERILSGSFIPIAAPKQD